jgi:hypothetical protein
MFFQAIRMAALAWVLPVWGADPPRVPAKIAPAPQRSVQAPRPLAKAAQGKATPTKSAPAPAGGVAALAVLDRWSRMSPEQRQAMLAKLPPDRRQAMLDRMERWNRLSPQEKDRQRARYERFSHLPADKQALVRRQIQNLVTLPDDRRPSVSREYDELRRLTQVDRRVRINSEEFRSRFTPREQEILRDLADNMANPTRQPVQAGR